MERFAEKHEGEFDDKYELIALFIDKQANKGIYTWFGVEFKLIFDELISREQSEIIDEIESINNADFSNSNVEVQNATVTNETLQIIEETVPVWIVDNHTMIGVEDQNTGLECDYQPAYCMNHGATAFEVFPTDAFGLCPKRPQLGFDKCWDHELKDYCGYCVFLEDTGEKRYVAALIESRVSCKMCCNEEEIVCKGGNCANLGGEDWGPTWPTSSSKVPPTTTTTTTETTAKNPGKPVCKCTKLYWK